ncbi:MAG: hypothetical protein IPQ05_18320 [Leptospiraceae bacterium]|nr:hypothetical protein [Leptospiraceae bacterium]
MHGILESFLTFFFPFTAGGSLELAVSSTDFSFSEFTSVDIHAFRLTGKSINQFLMVFIPAGKTPKGFTNTDLSSPNTCRQIFLSLHNLGYEIDKVEYVNGGNKNLSTPPDLYKQEKAIFRFQFHSQNVYLMLPYSFLRDLSILAGHGWMKETSIESLLQDFTASIESFERSILYGKSHLFQNLNKLLLATEPKFIPAILSDLQSKNLLSYNHLASFHVFYQEEINLVNFLPAEVKKTVLRLASSIMPLLASPKIRARWQRQIDYYFQNVFSILLFASPVAKKYTVDTSKSEELSRLINQKRLIMLSSLSSPEKMITEIIKEGRVNDLIGGEGKDLLIDSVAHKESLPLEELFKLFRESFREDLKFKIQEKEKKLKDLSEAKISRDYMIVKLRFFRFMEDNIIKKFQLKGKTHITLLYLHTLLKTLSADKMCLLYNTLGFELLASLFDSLRYLPNSPLSPKEVDSFLLERISHLPNVEREIVEDIYFERINQDRLMGMEVIENRFTEITRRIAAMEQIGYLEAIHD